MLLAVALHPRRIRAAPRRTRAGKVNLTVLIGGLLLVVPLVAVLGIGFKFDPQDERRTKIKEWIDSYLGAG